MRRLAAVDDHISNPTGNSDAIFTYSMTFAIFVIFTVNHHGFRHPYMGDEGKNGLYLRFFYAVLSGIPSTINFAAYTIEIGQKNTEILTSDVWNSENIRMFETMSHRVIKEIANFGIIFGT